MSLNISQHVPKRVLRPNFAFSSKSWHVLKWNQWYLNLGFLVNTTSHFKILSKITNLIKGWRRQSSLINSYQSPYFVKSIYLKNNRHLRLAVHFRRLYLRNDSFLVKYPRHNLDFLRINYILRFLLLVYYYLYFCF